MCGQGLSGMANERGVEKDKLPDDGGWRERVADIYSGSCFLSLQPFSDTQNNSLCAPVGGAVVSVSVIP